MSVYVGVLSNKVDNFITVAFLKLVDSIEVFLEITESTHLEGGKGFSLKIRETSHVESVVGSLFEVSKSTHLEGSEGFSLKIRETSHVDGIIGAIEPELDFFDVFS